MNFSTSYLNSLTRITETESGKSVQISRDEDFYLLEFGKEKDKFKDKSLNDLIGVAQAILQLATVKTELIVGSLDIDAYNGYLSLALGVNYGDGIEYTYGVEYGIDDGLYFPVTIWNDPGNYWQPPDSGSDPIGDNSFYTAQEAADALADYIADKRAKQQAAQEKARHLVDLILNEENN